MINPWGILNFQSNLITRFTPTVTTDPVTDSGTSIALIVIVYMNTLDRLARATCSVLIFRFYIVIARYIGTTPLGG